MPDGGPFSVPGADIGCRMGFGFEPDANGTALGVGEAAAVAVTVALPVLGGTTILIVNGHRGPIQLCSDR